MNLNQLEKYYLGEFRLETDPVDSQELMVISRDTNRKDEMVNYQKFLQKRLKIKHPNLIQLKYVDQDERKDWCSVSYRSLAKYEYFRNNLKKEIQRRRQMMNYFKPVELLRIVYDAIDVMAYL